MSQIAISIGETAIYWNSIIIVLGILACFAMSMSLYTATGGKGASICVMTALAVLLSLFLSRFLHWYCHEDQYTGLMNCLTDFSIGSFCMPGVIFGVLLAAKLTQLIRCADSSARLLDAAAPGLALCIALIRLSALFNSSCRSKIVVTNPLLQGLPVSSAVTDSSGSVQYLFATFFFQFILCLVLAAALLSFYINHRRRRIKGGESRDGHVINMFLLFYGCIEIVMDSTRYDASFIHFRLLTFLNKFTGFISFFQIVAAIFIVYLMVKYSKISIRADALHWYHWALWVLCLGGMAAIGVCEYLVQRHGDWFIKCYSIMTLGCIAVALAVHRMYRCCCIKKSKQA